MPRCVLAIVAALLGLAVASAQEPPPQERTVFRGGVDLVRVTATVTDRDGRFVTGLRRDDFAVFEDGERQEIAQFNNDRSPVSLGILLDTSGSMTRDKMAAARAALDRFLDLLDREDELFVVEFADGYQVRQEWTKDRGLVSKALRATPGSGNTALFDAVAAAVPKAATGQHRKKALLVISDGNDSHSSTPLADLQQTIRNSEVLVYAIGIDSAEEADDPPRRRNPPRIPVPQSPFPPTPRFPGIELPRFPPATTPPIADTFPSGGGLRVDGDALRRMTDDTGGLTEIIRGVRELPRATARIADELGRQYDLGYASNRPRDGKWHAIRVEVPGRRVIVRARTGFFAS